ncbi:hypothetical protein D3C73_1473500 [compost metagenome]
MLELLGHHREQFILEMAAGLGFGQTLTLFVMHAFVPGQVAVNLYLALETLAF